MKVIFQIFMEIVNPLNPPLLHGDAFDPFREGYLCHLKLFLFLSNHILFHLV